jgi:hypothetical protein
LIALDKTKFVEELADGDSVLFFHFLSEKLLFTPYLPPSAEGEFYATINAAVATSGDFIFFMG